MTFRNRFTAVLLDREINALRTLHGMLETDDVVDREQFCDLMKAAFSCDGIDPRALAADLGYSLSSVYRWMEGASAPHKSLWPQIIAWVMAGLERKIIELDVPQPRLEVHA